MDNLTEQILCHILSDEQLFFSVYEKIDENIFEDVDKEIYKSLKTQLLAGAKLNSVEVSKKTTRPDVSLDRIQELILKTDYNTDIDTVIHRIFSLKKIAQLKQLAIDLNVSIHHNPDDPDVVFNEMNDFIKNYGVGQSSKLLSMTDHVQNVLDIVKHNQENEGLTGVDTGFKELNRKTNGLQGGDLIIIAGETSQGKTSLALNIANTASETDDVHFITMEMTSNQLTARLMAGATGYNSNRILTAKLADSDLAYLSGECVKVRGKKILIDGSNSDIDKIISSIRRGVVINDTKLVVIDYLQLIKSNASGNKEQRVADITRRLKNLAIDLEIPIILISQLNRDRDRPFPRLVRLRDSGQIEEAADIVIFVYRPEFYGIDTFQDLTPAKGLAQIIIAKGRNIGIGTFYLKFEEELTKFTNYDGQYSNEL